MKKIVGITSVQNVGCTFVEWSIHFLSGQHQYYNVSIADWRPLSTDPVTTMNAHGHVKNIAVGSTESSNFIKIFQDTPGDLFSFYPFRPHADLVADLLGKDMYHLSTDDFQQILKEQNNDYQKLFEDSCRAGVKMIYLESNPRNILYHNTARTLDRMPFSKERPVDSNAIKNQIDQVFFADSVEEWADLGLTEIWDRRERLALCKRPFDAIDTPLNFSLPHFWLASEDLWYNGNQALHQIMAYLELPINTERLLQWELIYRRWQKIQLDVLDFVYKYQHIVDAIVNDWYYKIDLTFDQEVIIQHCLIYQHGLNLKTWQLSKFPSDTRELHKLLEPNIHTRK